MGFFRQLLRGLRGLTRTAQIHDETREEVEHYLAESEAAHRARGLSAAEARRAALLELEGVGQTTEAVTESGWEAGLETALRDLRFAFRRLRHEPGFVLVTALTLGLGIAASTAILSAVAPILFRPLPYPEADRIVAVWDLGPNHERAEVTYGSFEEIRSRSHGFDAMAIYRPWQPTLTGRSEPERLEGQWVSWEYFGVLGMEPAIGRGFSAEDDRPGAANVVLLSDRLWRRRFNGDASVIGQGVKLGDDSYTILGVMPRGFTSVLSPEAEVWSPARYDLSQDRAWGHHLRMVGRLASTTTLAGAIEELARIAGNPVPDFARRPWAALSQGLLLVPLQADLVRNVRPALLAVVTAVGVLLLIALVNASSLFLVRALRRQGEFAVRAALGAGPGRLMRQLVIEHLLVALCAALVGSLGAWVGVRALIALSPAGLPRLDAIRLDGTLLVIALGIALGSGLLIGLAVALQVVRLRPEGTLHLASRRLVGGQRRVRAALVVTQMALALVLLAGSGLLLRSMQRLLAIDPGFTPDNLLTLQVQLSGSRFSSDSTTWSFFENALAAVRRVPGVTSASLTNQLPLSGDQELFGVRLDPPSSLDPGEEGGTFRYAVSPDYFATMGMPLVRGRLLEPGDRAGAAPVAVVSASFARTRLAGRDPVGQRIRIGEGWPYTVVGVVGDVKQVSLAADQANAVYTTPSQWAFADRVMSLVIRGPGEMAALAPAIRRAIWSVDPDQAVTRVVTMDALIARTAAERRFVLVLFGCFAAAALVLAATGLYGVVAGSVAERIREFGVRAALGASPGRVLWMVLGQGLLVATLGTTIGLVAALMGSRLIASILFQVSALDPLTWLGVLGLLAAVTLLASLLPAWRAVRVDPTEALRVE